MFFCFSTGGVQMTSKHRGTRCLQTKSCGSSSKGRPPGSFSRDEKIATTTNNQQPTTNHQPTTNNKQQTTINNEQQSTTIKQIVQYQRYISHDQINFACFVCFAKLLVAWPAGSTRPRSLGSEIYANYMQWRKTDQGQVSQCLNMLRSCLFQLRIIDSSK